MDDTDVYSEGHAGGDLFNNGASRGRMPRSVVVAKRSVSGTESVILGEGAPPRIIVPLVGSSCGQLYHEMNSIDPDLLSCIDLFEWRIDRLVDMVNRWESACELVCSQSSIPVIATVRTVDEGGFANISHQTYAAIIRGLLHYVDAIDVQVSIPQSQELIEDAHRQGCIVIGSVHDFEGTPPSNDIATVAREMEKKGVDIVKAAYVCHQPDDVLSVLSAQVWCRKNLKIPSMIVGMGDIGSVTRVVGPILGGVGTFASVNVPHTPGQLQVQDSHTIFNILKKNG